MHTAVRDSGVSICTSVVIFNKQLATTLEADALSPRLDHWYTVAFDGNIVGMFGKLRDCD